MASIKQETHLRGVTRNRRGVSAIEWALLGALIAAGMAIGAAQLSKDASRTFSLVGGALDSGDRVVRSDDSDDRRDPATEMRPTGYPWISLAILSFAVVAWMVERRIGTVAVRCGCHPSAPGKLMPDVPQVASRKRYALKRLRILNAMVHDNHKLLPSDLRVADLMTAEPKVASSTTTVAELRTLIAENSFRHVLICDKARKLLGVVSDRDLHGTPETAVASSIMAARPKTVASDSLVNDAITVLLHEHFSSLPVVDDGRLVGIITTTDVVMTLQCTMLAVEQMVVDLRSRSDVASNLSW